MKREWNLKGIAAAVALVAVSASASLPSAASAGPPISVKPAKPYVDDAIRVTIKPRARLPVGFHYEAQVWAADGDGCSERGYAKSNNRGRKGKPLTIRIRHGQGDILDPGANWCQGKASVRVYRVKNGSSPGPRYVAIKYFRIYGMP